MIWKIIEPQAAGGFEHIVEFCPKKQQYYGYENLRQYFPNQQMLNVFIHMLMTCVVNEQKMWQSQLVIERMQ